MAHQRHTLCHAIPTKWRSYRDHKFRDVISPYHYHYRYHLFAQTRKRTHDQRENKSRTKKAQKTGAYILPIIFTCIAPKSKIESRAHYAPEPAGGAVFYYLP